jgi:hypothetical protein
LQAILTDSEHAAMIPQPPIPDSEQCSDVQFASDDDDDDDDDDDGAGAGAALL